MRAKTTRPISDFAADTRRADIGGKPRDITVADATPSDLTEIIDLDARITGFARADFWNDLFRQRAANDTLCVLVATRSGKMIGYALGEVRSWPVRAPACGWLYAIGVEKNYRLHKCASVLMTELISRFKQSGVSAIRTVIEVDDYLLMSFLRSFGMTAGPFVELEMALPAGEPESNPMHGRR
jgi:ribosomal protein S18 acetylase RimI-like enzyme